jgi:hypothetical protein
MRRRDLLTGMAPAAGGSGLARTARTASAQEMTDDEQANVETVRRFFGEFRTNRNIEALREIVADDYKAQDPTAAPGVDAYISRSDGYFRELDALFNGYTWTEDAVIASWSAVGWRGREGGETKSGRLVEVSGVYWFELNDDHRITTFYGGADRMSLQEQMYG